MTPIADWLILDAVLAVAAGWLLVGAAGLAGLRRLRFVARWLFPLGGVLGLLLAGLGLAAIAGEAEVAVLPIGLPGLPFHPPARCWAGRWPGPSGPTARPGGTGPGNRRRDSRPER